MLKAVPYTASRGGSLQQFYWRLLNPTMPHPPHSKVAPID
jgi:hypothetical protein